MGRPPHRAFPRTPARESTVWLDDKKIGSARSLVAPHEFELGPLAPGQHRLTVRLDNRQIVRDPQNDGHGVDAHAVTDGMGATWNGIAGRIELTATAPVWIADAQVFPNVAKKSARLRVTIGNATGQAGAGTLSAGGASAAATWDAAGGTAELEVALGAGAKTWDEFQPALQQLTVLLSAGAAKDSRTVTFGLREITWQGKDPLINGRPVNSAPRTSASISRSPATRRWTSSRGERSSAAVQEFGLNGIRFHSCCPPEAAFTAADELGFYLQPECGLWAPFNPDSTYTKYLNEETPLLLRAYGNHPSFVLFSPSNEPAGRYTQITPQWAKDNYTRDPRRLYSAGTGWNRPEQVTGGAQFRRARAFRRAGELRNTSGWFGKDFPRRPRRREHPRARPRNRPVVRLPGFRRDQKVHRLPAAVELQYFQTYRRADRRRRDEPRPRVGLGPLSTRVLQRGTRGQPPHARSRRPPDARYPRLPRPGHRAHRRARRVLGSEELRNGRRVPPLHSQTVPLARLAQRTFTTAETLTADAEFYHFAENPIAGAQPYWKIVRLPVARLVRGGTEAASRPGSPEPGYEDGVVVASGEWPVRDIPIGKSIPLRRDLRRSLEARRARRLQARRRTEELHRRERLEFLALSRADRSSTPAADVLVTDKWSDAEARLAAGGKVLFTPTAADLDPARSPPMKRTPVFWNIQMTVRPPQNPRPRFDAMLGLLCDASHPALARLPHRP